MLTMKTSLIILATILYCCMAHPEIKKITPSDFLVKSSDEKEVRLKITGIGVIEYMAEVQHTSELCQGCRMFIIRNDRDQYFIQHQNLLEKGSGIGNDPARYVHIPIRSGRVNRESIQSIILYHHLHQQSESEMMTTPISGLMRVSNNSYHLPMEATNALMSIALSGEFSILQEETF